MNHGEDCLINGQEELQPVHAKPQQEVPSTPFAFHDIQISSSEHEPDFLDGVNDVIDYFKFKKDDMVDVVVEENLLKLAS
ncbi:hypothetical protein LIER_13817 [Lithospermum erythrorhizon]|uniref:Uncharacterized protein n=1 Tax=Lithospermum erythrorhizon TaxID=34254 RepID=A0AAV3PWS1_LITER